MKKAFAILACVCALIGGIYVAASKWAIRHETLNLVDTARARPIAVDIAVRRDYEMKADAGYAKLPVAIISNGNTVKNTEYSFLANVLAARGYLVASIQQDLPTDPPLVTKVGMPYVGRGPIYERGEANILFVRGQLEKIHPNANYDHLTLVGHSNGGDVSMFFAKEHPELVSKVITLDNLRVPFVLSDKMKILSFRSKDPNFRTDPGVLPRRAIAKNIYPREANGSEHTHRHHRQRRGFLDVASVAGHSPRRTGIAMSTIRLHRFHGLAQPAPGHGGHARTGHRGRRDG